MRGFKERIKSSILETKKSIAKYWNANTAKVAEELSVEMLGKEVKFPKFDSLDGEMAELVFDDNRGVTEEDLKETRDRFPVARTYPDYIVTLLCREYRLKGILSKYQEEAREIGVTIDDEITPPSSRGAALYDQHGTYSYSTVITAEASTRGDGAARTGR